MSNKLSVIVPVYNVENYLHQCVDSIINQTFADLEIILVNDGSTDSSPQICDDFAKKDSRIKVIHIQNSGVSVARNIGIESATSDYITFVDSDDWLELSMYENMFEINNQDEKFDVIMCDFTNVKENSKEQISANIRKGIYSKKQIVEELFPTLLVAENFGRIPIVSVCNCLFHCSILVKNKIRFDAELKFAEDYLFMANLMTEANSYYYLKENYFYNYRQYDDSRSKKFQNSWWQNLLNLNHKLKNLLENNKDFNFSRQLKLQLLHSVFFVLNSIYKNKTLNFGKKLKEVRLILNTPELENSFSDLSLKKQVKAQKILFFFIKNKMAFSYLAFLRIISFLKNA
ncbi:Glycosyltransferase involved in cell wall bisynthesis [Halpernia humi]|uniref:Glycosyltransferase involved in cell wall bisynthesis n=1 Tax=Halpernia humi TaxID=493375 RepID=A0A1H6APU9_9FLAO|nr:glycosyltransferase [Halpernia humi]SEG50220.1 Glycosyltransferase involved in cell wall bisynthesis [Halpernia humi]